MKQFLNEELKRINFLSKYNRGVVISEQTTQPTVSSALQYKPQGLPTTGTATPAPTASAPVTPAPAAGTTAPAQSTPPTADQIMKVQQKLVDMGYKLGSTGPNKNGVDGKWGPLTSQAFQQAKELVAAKKEVATAQTDKKAAEDLAAQQKAEREKQLADVTAKVNTPAPQPQVTPVEPAPQVQQTPQQIRQDTRAQIQDLRAQGRQQIQQARQDRRQERTLARQARRNERRFGSPNPEYQGVPEA